MSTQRWKKGIAAALFIATGLSFMSPVQAEDEVQTGELIIIEPQSHGRDVTAMDADRPESDGNTWSPNKWRRDPFSVTNKLANRKNKSSSQRTRSGPVFKSAEQPVEIPKMSLRGHLQGINDEDEIVALLEIEGGGVFIVREGDTVGLHEIGYDSVIRIKKISRLHLVIESGSLGKMIIVR